MTDDELARELQQLPLKLHLLCPRQSEEDFSSYDEAPSDSDIKNDPEDVLKISQARARRGKFIASLQLLAYDGQESVQYQRYIWERLDDALGKCELCIREYYVAKLDLLARLREDYDEDEIHTFFDLINNRDITRIQDGLSSAVAKLRSLPEQKRTLKGLDPSIIYCLFEALSCEAFLKDNSKLEAYFDEPFKLIQTKTKLKSRELMPAATRFLFETRKSRFDWAVYTWQHLTRSLTELEWNWTVKDVVQTQLQQASTTNEICRVWLALSFIVQHLDQRQIVHGLGDLQPKVCFTALNHMSKKDQGLRFLLQTLNSIMVKSPDTFWGEMGALSASAVIELTFESPDFEKHLSDNSHTDYGREQSGVDDMLSWIEPLFASLKPANRPPACRTLVTQLLKRTRNVSISVSARLKCYDSAMEILVQTLRCFTDDTSTRQSVARVVLSDTLETVGDHIGPVLTPSVRPIDLQQHTYSRSQSLDVVRNSLALECQCLKADFELLSKGQALQHGSSSYSQDTWSAVIAALHDDDVQLSTSTLLGTLSLPGLEPFMSKDPTTLGKEKRIFNDTFDNLTGLFSRVLEKLAEFQASHLDALFGSQETSMPLIAALFSADTKTYQAAVDLIKNISAQSGRKEALAHLLEAFLGTTVFALCWSFRRIANMRTFASVPRMMKTGMEVLDVLCDPQAGLLRTLQLDPRDHHAISNYWLYQWLALKVVFRNTERWSLEVHNKPLMTEVCRDAMQYAEILFEQYDVFASALISTKPDRADSVPKSLLENPNGSPGATLDAMVRWLRLRDQYLVDTLVKLVTKLLHRLGDHEIVIAAESLGYVEGVATTKTVKTMLSGPQKAELIRALEAYYKRPVVSPELSKQASGRGSIASTTDIGSGSATPISSRAQSVDEFADSDISDADFYKLSGKPGEFAKARVLARERELNKPAAVKTKLLKAPDKKDDVSAFLETRRREKEAAEKRRLDALAGLRGKAGIGAQTKGQGSALDGIGVKGKDHDVPQDTLMLSSGSESESDDELDKQLFGSRIKADKSVEGGLHKGLMRSIATGPVKKIKQVRSVKDMRARLAPDLSSLHKTILAWDFFAPDEMPPHTNRDNYALVTNTFRTAAEYQKTFEPLLILEAWQSFRSAREDGSFRPFEVKVSNRLTVDSFVEVSTSMTITDSKELGLGVADVVLLSKAKRPESDPEQPHCLARVKEISRKKGQIEIVYRVSNSSNSLLQSLSPGSPLWGIQILSLTPLEREYGALMALKYYDLCDEIIQAKPSPLLDYSDQELQPIVQIYEVNMAQAKAVKSAMDNDAFTLIQGPPGSGKTKTICALVGAMLTTALSGKPSTVAPVQLGTKGRSAPALIKAVKKVLVCAPSNAAVDELVMRFKQGVKTMAGSTHLLSVVRLGRSNAINSNVKDVTLEELVNAKLNAVAPQENADRDINEIMMEHKATSEEVFNVRIELDDMRSSGKAVAPELENKFDGLKRKKAQLSLQIDSARDKQKTAQRDAELHRKRMQQEILDSAHVLCATLSGSGHEIFQGLNIEFETVIIDEAAQSIELSALIPLKYGCSKCILVGDPKQLPPTVLSREAARFQYEQSLFARMEKNHQKDIHLLDTQYRMHPEISLFPSKTFYDSRLKDGADMAKLRSRPWHHSSLLAPYRFFDVEGMQAAARKGHSLINIAELNVAMELYHRLITDCRRYDFRGKIGIITPYKGQLKELKARFSYRYGEEILSAIEFNTTDAFQGRESEIIIFSCVRALTRGIGFLNDVRRMNVGLTRAKCSLWVLGNSQALVQGEFWRGLVQDAKSRNLYTDGDVLSLLQRPLLTEDMMKDDEIMRDVESDQTPAAADPPSLVASAPTRHADSMVLSSGSSSRNSTMSEKAPGTAPSPIIASRSTPSNEPKLSKAVEQPSPVPNRNYVQWQSSSLSREASGPSGGRNGLNPHAVCIICGSNAHFSHNCDNLAAQEASFGSCIRCKQPGHTYRSCPAPRCLECGEVGHTGPKCTVPEELRLNKFERAKVSQQEVDFGHQKDKARQRRAEKRLGEHGAKVPIVGTSDGGKRKRGDEVVVPGAPTGPKSMKSSVGGRAPDAIVPAGSDALTAPGAARNGNTVKAGVPLGPSVVRKKKPKDDDMFMAKKR